MARLLAALALCLCCLVSPAAPLQAQSPGGVLFGGSLPGSGGIAVIALYQPIAVTSLTGALDRQGCDAVSLTLSDRGALSTYIVGAPAFVNAQFPPQLEPVPLIVRCRTAPPDVDAHLLALVTPDHALDPSFVPSDLVALPDRYTIVDPLYLTREAAEALADMLDAARDAGRDVRVRSAYRSYAEQRSTFQYWVNLLGEGAAERQSARAGHSEHQLGTTVDVTSASVGWELDTDFANTSEGQWIERNAWRYGFVLSYPDGTEQITGYRFEPWHLRYIGRPNAEWLRQSGLTLTEYLEALHQKQ